ncbi:hypothetical protein VULLAG_LOCUS7226 [Vulpes lagopus]
MEGECWGGVGGRGGSLGSGQEVQPEWVNLERPAPASFTPLGLEAWIWGGGSLKFSFRALTCHPSSPTCRAQGYSPHAAVRPPGPGPGELRDSQPLPAPLLLAAALCRA